MTARPASRRMDRVVKAAWIEALRSGEYEQGRGSLAEIDADGVTRYCCLGVLCDLAAKAGAIPAPVKTNALLTSSLAFDQHTSFPSPRVRAWAGLDRDDPLVGPAGQTASLATFNDNVKDPKTFNQIADLIEQYL